MNSPLLSAALLAATAGIVPGQATFTKITDDPITQEQSIVVAWGDYDGDGHVDLFLAGEFHNFLYHNNGNGTFSKVTANNPISELEKPMALDTRTGAWGDYDNDGRLDLFVASGGYGSASRTNLLYHNEGNGGFTQVKQGPIATTRVNSWTGAWVDYDRDGRLDLWVGNNDNRRNDFLYHNDGDGQFTPVVSPVSSEAIDTAGGGWADIDNDGDPDLVVTGFIFASGMNTSPNPLFVNDGTGKFTRQNPSPFGPTSDPNDVSQEAAWGDFDNDGDLDLFLAHTGSLPNLLFRNNGDGTFAKVTAGEIVGEDASTVGCAWADYDNDGWLDLFVANIDDAQGLDGWHNSLFHNNGDGTFTRDANSSLVQDLARNVTGQWADIDNDGFLDLVVAQYTDGTSLFRNDGNGNHWMMLKLIGTASNRSAIGAKVRLKATIGGQTFWQMRQIGGSHDSFGYADLRVHFGLGNATNAEIVRIEWPSGTVQELTNVASKQILTVTEPPQLKAVGIGRIQVRGLREVDYTIEVSEDLSRWTHAGVVKGGGEFVDAEAGQHAARFYRAVAP